MNRLALSYNRLDPFSIDPSFCLLSRLRYLNLKGNHLSQFPPPVSILLTQSSLGPRLY